MSRLLLVLELDLRVFAVELLLQLPRHICVGGRHLFDRVEEARPLSRDGELQRCDSGRHGTTV